MRPLILARDADPVRTRALVAAGVHPLLARLWAARGLDQTGPTEWAALIPPNRLTHVDRAGQLLADAIQADRRLLIVADYDCDGATACAVAVRALRAMGAQVDFLVPNRFETGYGLSPAVVELALRHPAGRPDLLVTVDNGIASIEGVAAARAAGIEVIVTDHHLPGPALPDALAIVNPNQAGCGFPSKHLAGVGVIFYVMLALRAALRARGALPPRGGPKLETYADLVALGTVADVVRLDANNRLLVGQGLRRIRQGRMQVGLAALFEVAGRNPARAGTDDLGFALGPRINAAGRMADMSLGIHCLLEDDPARALELAKALDGINRERRARETIMREEALAHLDTHAQARAASVCVWQPGWHPGVIGLVASRLKETYWRPALAFAPDDGDTLRGSGRSIPEVHLRDALDLVSKRLPGAILQFGGHAMAAGLTLRTAAFDDFSRHFDDAVRTLGARESFEPRLDTDGSLEPDYMTAETASLLADQIWGAGFPPPLFQDRFRVLHQRLLKDTHLKLFLERDGQRLDAVWFNHAEPLPDLIEAVYRLDCNTWGGRTSVQLLIEDAREAA
ncbi:single-stranded-DNA-specific exonuclease RecJ [Castellaniella denitrificans]|uniref:Single-stranded-DNA-specific exonuclease RecJ n=1 Tax=Castellaniella denitrificans TaxID=56119 RepID=A0ABT4M782_9BURK|nr:single-stranded-DNA-specific exonuclease RecJ [Castellaniella denitrificans]MCZ4331188.1 single-stranded-DNA-specific exonuclease RecJ [Castellaniella denitrificans]